MKKKTKEYLALAVVGGLIFSSGTLAGYKYARKTREPQSIEDLIELKKPVSMEDIIRIKKPYIQSLFDKEIEKIQSSIDVVTIDFKDRSKLEIWHDIIVANGASYINNRDLVENNFTYRIEDITEETPDGKKTIYTPEDLTALEERFYKSILRNISIWNYNRIHEIQYKK